MSAASENQIDVYLSVALQDWDTQWGSNSLFYCNNGSCDYCINPFFMSSLNLLLTPAAAYIFYS